MNPKICPVCQASVPEDAPGGLCPACVLRDAGEPRFSGQSAPALEEIAAAFPHLEILSLIGHGGMGFVYKARQPRLDRVVALKILSPELRLDPAFEERFAREARVLGKLRHPNIVTLHEHGESGGFFYLLMEFVDGVNLRQAMSAGRFTPDQALAMVPAICDALQTAHAQGVWHRDIKPENILLDHDGQVKIADFGIARIAGDAERNFTLTRTGGQLGSAAYMAPEQHEKPHDVDHRADIYSLGVVIYEMLTGELPLGRFPLPSQRSAVNARIDEIVLRTLEKERELRQQSAGEVKTEFQTSAHSPSAPMKNPATASDSLPWSVKLPLILFFSGVFALFAFTASTEASISQHYWRKLWHPIDSGRFTLELESAPYQQFLRLWFGSGLILIISGMGLGLRTLYRIKRGNQTTAGHALLRRFILWPCILAIPICAFFATNEGMHPHPFNRWETLFSQWIGYLVTLLVVGLLFFIGAGPAPGKATPGKAATYAAIVSVVLMFSSSFVSKKLSDHWIVKNFPSELWWNTSWMNESERAGLTEALARVGSATSERLQTPVAINDGELTVRFIVGDKFMTAAWHNAFLLRLKAIDPDHRWGKEMYKSKVWGDVRSAMHWPTVFVIMSTILAAITAAWCGRRIARRAALFGLGISVLMPVLPAWPIPDDIGRQILSGPPPAPERPFVPDFSERTLAVQSVFDAAFLGDSEIVREGLSERLLAKLATPQEFQSAMKLLGKRRWVADMGIAGHVVVLPEPNPADFNSTDLVSVKEEDGRWKLDELPKN